MKLSPARRPAVPEEPGKERVSGPYDFENEFQFQLQGYAAAARTVNPPPHNLV
jgi:hypothetical protein